MSRYGFESSADARTVGRLLEPLVRQYARVLGMERESSATVEYGVAVIRANGMAEVVAPVFGLEAVDVLAACRTVLLRAAVPGRIEAGTLGALAAEMVRVQREWDEYNEERERRRSVGGV